MHKMEKEVGSATALEWAKILKFRADPITKLDSEPHRQLIVPVQWFEATLIVTECLSLSGDKKTTKEDPDC